MKLMGLLLLLAGVNLVVGARPHPQPANAGNKPAIKTGAEQTAAYLPYLKE
jgi:hypothetical protein